MKRRFLYTLAILCLAGCNLNEYCDEDQYEQDGKCYRCRVGEHLNANKTGCEANTDTDCGGEHINCTEIPFTKVDGTCDADKGICMILCKDGYVESNGRCIDSNAQTCTENKDCSLPKNAISVKCDGFLCVATCGDGFHLSAANGCIANAYTSCDSDDDCNDMYGVKAAKCNDHLCSVSACEEDYHLNDTHSACDMDTEISCGVSQRNCQQIEHVSIAGCSNGKCQIESCRTGYHPSDDANFCDDDSKVSCGNKKVNCSGIEHSFNQACTQGICEFECAEGYLKNNDRCIFNSCPNGQDFIPEIDDCLVCDDINIDEYLCPYEDCTSDQTVYSSIATCLRGTVKIRSIKDKTQILFNNLRYIYNQISISGDKYEQINFPKLEAAKDFNIELSQTLQTTINLPLLKLIHDDLTFKKIKTDTINLNNLTHIDGKMIFESISSDSLDMKSLVESKGDISIKNSLINSIDISKLASTNNILLNYGSDTPDFTTQLLTSDLLSSNIKIVLGYINGKTGTVNIKFPDLKTLKGDIDIDGMPKSTISFDNLNKIEGTLTLKKDGKYLFPSLKSLAKLKPVYSINSINKMSVISLPALESVDSIESLESTSLSTVELPNLVNAKNITLGGRYYEYDDFYNPPVVTDIENSSLKSLSLPNLETAESIQINSFNQLESIDMPKLKKVSGTIKICSCPRLKAENCNLGENECKIVSSCD